MVSGLVTSPCDQERIFSGEASMMRMASKSVMGLVSSNGFERNKATLLGLRFLRSPRSFPEFLKGWSFPGGRRTLEKQRSVVSDRILSAVGWRNFEPAHSN